MKRKTYNIILSNGKDVNQTVCTSYSLHNILQKFIDENLKILCIALRPEKEIQSRIKVRNNRKEK